MALLAASSMAAPIGTSKNAPVRLTPVGPRSPNSHQAG
jgi:hypothetical protein